MGTVNKAIVVGYLGRDPEISQGRNGKFATFNVATSQSWRDKQTGERKEKTQWHRIVVFNERLAEVAEKYLKKGSMVYIEGAMETRKWVDKEQIERYTTEVILGPFNSVLTMLDKKEGSGDYPPRITDQDYIGPEPSRRIGNDSSYEDSKRRELEDGGDEIPF